MVFGQNKSKTDIWSRQCANLLHLNLEFRDALSPSHTRQEGEKVQCCNIDYCIRQSIDSARYRSPADCSIDIFSRAKCYLINQTLTPASAVAYVATSSIFLRVPPEQV